MDPALRGNGESLPAELFSRIFEYLSLERYHAEITSCRLVSRRWCEVSSPYLITTVVIADRLGALQKLREVLEHPSRLVWDGSQFQSFDFRDYGASIYSAMAPSPWRWPAKMEHRESQRIDLANITSLLQSVPAPLDSVPHRKRIHPCEEDRGESERQWDEATDEETDEETDERTDEETNEETNEETDEKRDDEWDGEWEEEWDEEWDKTESLHRGFVKYHCRYQHQSRLEYSRASLRYLHMAFQKLPNLRHFEYTDFRVLSRNGETFSDLCSRLFGPVMCPSLLFDNPPGYFREKERFTSWKTLYDCLRELLKISPELDSLRFGRTNFHGPDIVEALRTPLLRCDDKHIPQDDKNWRQLLSHVQYLTLPVTTCLGEIYYRPWSIRQYERLDNILEGVQKLLSYSEASLKHLELITKPFSGFSPSDARYRHRAEPLFGQVLGRWHFQKLRKVLLRGWFFSLQDIQDFLLKHAATLHEVHIIDCALTDCTETRLLEIAENSLGPALNLTGVEICGLAFNVAVPQSPDATDWDCLHLSQGCAIHQSHGKDQYPCYTLGRGPKPKSASEQLEVESALMGGRRNHIQRVIDENANRRYDEWWTEYAS